MFPSYAIVQPVFNMFKFCLQMKVVKAFTSLCAPQRIIAFKRLAFDLQVLLIPPRDTIVVRVFGTKSRIGLETSKSNSSVIPHSFNFRSRQAEWNGKFAAKSCTI